MEKIALKKVVTSYALTSFIIFLLSAFTSMMGVYGKGLGSTSISVELMAVIQLSIILIANLLLHGVFYFGGFNSAPITKGMGIGVVLGIAYFMVSVFALNMYNINTDSLQLLVSAMSGRIIEYGAGGIFTAVISVSDIGRWGLLRAF